MRKQNLGRDGKRHFFGSQVAFGRSFDNKGFNRQAGVALIKQAVNLFQIRDLNFFFFLPVRNAVGATIIVMNNHHFGNAMKPLGNFDLLKKQF